MLGKEPYEDGGYANAQIYELIGASSPQTWRIIMFPHISPYQHNVREPLIFGLSSRKPPLEVQVSLNLARCVCTVARKSKLSITGGLLIDPRRADPIMLKEWFSHLRWEGRQQTADATRVHHQLLQRFYTLVPGHAGPNMAEEGRW